MRLRTSASTDARRSTEDVSTPCLAPKDEFDSIGMPLNVGRSMLERKRTPRYDATCFMVSRVSDTQSSKRSSSTRSGQAAFWWPRFLSIARWFSEKERGQRGTIARAHAEVSGQIALEGPEGPFVLTAQADRIDVLSTGGLALLDYKTGAVPGNRDVEFGFAPQLPLEAAIAAEGGFGPEIPAAVPARLEYWRLTGREPAGEIKTLKGDRDGLILDALKGLRSLIALFDREETPYHAQPRPRWAPRFNDYAHLERARAWSAGDAEGEGP